MAPNPPFGPTNETSTQISTDVFDITSAGLALTAYGVLATLYFITLSLLWEGRRRMPRKTWTWISFITILFVIGTIGDGITMFLNQDAFVNHRNYPGGPGQFEIEQFALTYNAVGNVITVIGLWLTDALLIFRFYKIIGPRWWGMLLPCLMYLVSLVMSILLLHQIVAPGGTLWIPESINFALVYWSTSVANNVLITASIVGYLLWMRFRIRRYLGPKQGAASVYISVSAILVESAFLYTAFALAFLIPLALNSPVNLIFLQALPQVQLIAPLLIVLRMAQGRSLAKKKIEDTVGTATESSRPSGFRSDDSYTVSTFTQPQDTIPAHTKLNLTSGESTSQAGSREQFEMAEVKHSSATLC